MEQAYLVLRAWRREVFVACLLLSLFHRLRQFCMLGGINPEELFYLRLFSANQARNEGQRICQSLEKQGQYVVADRQHQKVACLAMAT